MAAATPEFILRPFVRSDVSDLVSKAIASFEIDEQLRIKHRYREKYPLSERRAVLRTLRTLLVRPSLVNLMAVAVSTGERVGFVSWAAVGPNLVAEQWKNHNTSWSNSFELNIIEMERAYAKRFDASHVDKKTMANESKNREATLTHSKEANHIELTTLFVAPAWKGKGVGKLLVEWGLDIARREWLPVVIDSSPVGKAFYEKLGFKVIYWVMVDEAETVSVAELLWEPEQCKGRWLEQDDEDNWKLKKTQSIPTS